MVHPCESLADPKTPNREIAALSEAMTESGLSSGTIEVVPAWRFVLEMGDVEESGRQPVSR